MASDRRPLNPTDGFFQRLFQAHTALEGRLGRRVPQGEVAEGVGKYIGKRPDQTTVGAWFKETVPPPVTVGWAVCRYYGVNCGWLYFNEGEMLSTAAYPADVKKTRGTVVETTQSRKRGRA